MEDVNRIRPWMKGPFELIKHANGHLKEKGDTDRRIALIGFDNAIEISIDVFIQLHPKLRNGVTIPREEAEHARKNYHTKIEFLDKYAADNPVTGKIPVESIVWYHQLRNDLYHSGNGLVPEIHVIEGSRDAAIQVFRVLFDIDISISLDGVKAKDTYADSDAYACTDNDQMEFLRIFIEFEKALRAFLQEQHEKDVHFLKSVADMWRFYEKNYGTKEKYNDIVTRAIEIRNSITHGRRLDLSENIMTSVRDLMDLIAYLDDRT